MEGHWNLLMEITGPYVQHVLNRAHGEMTTRHFHSLKMIQGGLSRDMCVKKMFDSSRKKCLHNRENWKNVAKSRENHPDGIRKYLNY